MGDVISSFEYQESRIKLRKVSRDDRNIFRNRPWNSCYLTSAHTERVRSNIDDIAITISENELPAHKEREKPVSVEENSERAFFSHNEEGGSASDTRGQQNTRDSCPWPDELNTEGVLRDSMDNLSSLPVRNGQRLLLRFYFWLSSFLQGMGIKVATFPRFLRKIVCKLKRCFGQ